MRRKFLFICLLFLPAYVFCGTFWGGTEAKFNIVDVQKNATPFEMIVDAGYSNSFIDIDFSASFDKDRDGYFASAEYLYSFDNGVGLGFNLYGSSLIYNSVGVALNTGGAGKVFWKSNSDDYLYLYLNAGFGGIFTWTQYFDFEENVKKYSDHDFAELYILGLGVEKVFLEKNHLWFNFTTLDKFDYNFGLCPVMDFGYSRDFKVSEKGKLCLYSRGKFDFPVLFTNLGRIKTFSISAGLRYDLSIVKGGAK